MNAGYMLNTYDAFFYATVLNRMLTKVLTFAVWDWELIGGQCHVNGFCRNLLRLLIRNTYHIFPFIRKLLLAALFQSLVSSEVPGFRHGYVAWKIPCHTIHDNDVIMGAMTQGCLLNYLSWLDQWKYQSSSSLAFVRGIHLWLVNSPHKGPVTRKMFPIDDVIMIDRKYRMIEDRIV